MIPPMWRRLFLVLFLCCGVVAAQGLPPPLAAREPFIVKSVHGDRVDEYHWLRDDDPKNKRPAVMRQLEAENAYTEATLARLKPLREQLGTEMRARVRADEGTLPVYSRGWWTWRQFEAGNEHPVLMRRRGGPEGMDPKARAEVLLDIPRMAIGFEFYSVAAVAMSPDGQWLAWTEDTSGRRIHSLRIQNLKTRRLEVPDIDGVLEDIVWAADSRTLFYVRQDPVTLQSGAVFRHRLGTPPSRDAKVYDETDKTLFVGLRGSASRRFVIIDVYGYDTSETLVVPAAAPASAASVLLARRPGVRATADHLGGRWVIRTNEQAPNFRLVEAPESAPDERATWRTLLPAREDTQLESVELFDQAIAVEERVAAERRVRLLGADGRNEQVAAAPGGGATLGENHDPASLHVRVIVQSLTEPPATVDLHVASGRQVLRRKVAVKGYDPQRYRSERVWLAARDGQRVPVTLAWRADLVERNGRAPLLLEGYGAYGDNYEPEFAERRISLLDRGFVVGIAHVRGGAELGQAWYEGGRLMNKHNTFNDFIDVTDGLVREGWAAADKVFAEGGSAGGLLMGVVANRAGWKYRGIALDVPFVDAVTTMLDPTIPLTAQEWRQWGDPRERADYDYLLSYSPYDNIVPQDYPPMLVTTALWDSQVQYYEPAKFVARLRATKTDRAPLLLHVEMNAGHGGAAGRYERLRHWAREYAFFIDLAGLSP